MDQQIIQFKIYHSQFSKAFFDFGDIELNEPFYKIKFRLSSTSLQEKEKLNYESTKYYGNSYPFEILKIYFVKKNNIDANISLLQNYSGGIFDLFTDKELSNQYYYYPLYLWIEYLGEEKLYEDLPEAIDSITDLILIERFTSIKSFIDIENKLLNTKIEQELNQLYNEAVTCNNYSKYINKTVSLILDDFHNFRMKLFDSKEDYFSFFSFVINDLYLTSLRLIFNKFQNDLVDENYSKIDKYIHIPKTKITNFKVSMTAPNLPSEQNRYLEVISKFKEQLISEKFITKIDTSDFLIFIDNRKKSIVKINWISSLTLLYTFYKQLVKKGIILGSKNEHWKILSKCFTVKGNSIYPHELVGLKQSTNVKMIGTLSQILDNFKNELLVLKKNEK
ncbi:hypothetical protein CMT60_00655 [Elizabethkingia anophelis]|uniref:hypothetical protein n=1 Tax=Elizabethkingia anophelis TaxID=1117645 RepID=UPI000D02747B|nr:hypothetical protein [Elizabethkingia anophelis]PRQ81635.1 hypothetical protein CMT60_00655 [Elizabethkingia anophelis]